MPVRPKRICARGGCQRLTDGRFCEAHQEQAREEAKAAAWSDSEGSAHSRGYGATWRRLRKLVLHRDPLCRGCGRAPSTDVDHVVARARGGEDTMENLQGLCSRCHGLKTALEGNAARKVSRAGSPRR